ncbi:hypothetical protein [Nocardioides fonticola]
MLHRLRRELADDPSLAEWSPNLHAILNSISVPKEQQQQAGQCLADSCARNPIESHVIPDSSLKRLAARNSIITPHLDNSQTGSFEIMTGKTRPVFFGYCDEHEKSLFPWEGTMEFDSPIYPQSQLMRVADAFWREQSLRCTVLRQVIDATGPDGHLERLRLTTAAKKTIEHKRAVWSQAAAEIDRTVRDFETLRRCIRYGMKDADHPEAAAIGSVLIPSSAGHFLLLADAGHVPDFPQLDAAQPAPFVVSLLYGGQGSSLCFASTNAATAVVDRMRWEFSNDPEEAIKYALHWMRHGNFYWYINQEAWLEFDLDLRAKMKLELERGPHVAMALYASGGVAAHPILRWGNRWA